MPVTKIYTPIVISGIMVQADRFKSFVIRVRKKGSTELIINTEWQGKRLGNKWVIAPFVFSEAVKGEVYQYSIATLNTSGLVSAWSKWVSVTAGDNSFGATTWNNSIQETDHSLIVDIELQNPPRDFDRVELYERDTDSTVGSLGWLADYIFYKPGFTYMWTGSRLTTRYFFARAYDKSNNPSSLSSAISGQINVILPGDMDTIPPDNTTASLIMPGDL